MILSTQIRDIPSYQYMPWFDPLAAGSSGGTPAVPDKIITSAAEDVVDDAGNKIVYDETP